MSNIIEPMKFKFKKKATNTTTNANSNQHQQTINSFFKVNGKIRKTQYNVMLLSG